MGSLYCGHFALHTSTALALLDWTWGYCYIYSLFLASKVWYSFEPRLTDTVDSFSHTIMHNTGDGALVNRVKGECRLKAAHRCVMCEMSVQQGLSNCAHFPLGGKSTY